MSKMGKKRVWIIFTVGVLIVSLASISWAWREDCTSKPLPPKERYMQWRNWGDLNLTPEQQKKIFELRLSFQEDTVDLRSQMMKKRIELQKLWLEDTPDKAKIYALLDEIAKIRGEITKKMVGYLFKLREILTPEQLQKLPFMGWGYGGFGLGRRSLSPRACW